MKHPGIVIFLQIAGFTFVTFSLLVAVAAIKRHNYAMNKLDEFARTHQKPDSALKAILVADSVYMFTDHR